MCLACTYPAGTGSFWLPGSQSNKPMRTGKALTEAGLSGEATGLPRGGSSSAAQLVVSASATVISVTGIRDEGGQARGITTSTLKAIPHGRGISSTAP